MPEGRSYNFVELQKTVVLVTSSSGLQMCKDELCLLSTRMLTSADGKLKVFMRMVSLDLPSRPTFNTLAPLPLQRHAILLFSFLCVLVLYICKNYFNNRMVQFISLP